MNRFGQNYVDPYAYGYSEDVSGGMRDFGHGYSQPSNHNVYSSSSSSSYSQRGNTPFFRTQTSTNQTYVSSYKFPNIEEV